MDLDLKRGHLARLALAVVARVALDDRLARRLEGTIGHIEASKVDEWIKRLGAEMCEWAGTDTGEVEWSKLVEQIAGEREDFGITLWRDPEHPEHRVRFSNGVLVAHIGPGQASVDCRRFHQLQFSHYVPRTEVYFGRTFMNRGKPFHYGEIAAKLEEMFECEMALHSVRAGFDRYYCIVFERIFRECDRQRLMVENAITFLLDYDLEYGQTLAVLETGKVAFHLKVQPSDEEMKKMMEDNR